MRFQQWAEGCYQHPSTPVKKLLVRLPFGFGGGSNGSGSIGSALLLALELGELPILDQQIKTCTTCVGLFVAPFVHAEPAIDEEFLALLNELAEIFGGSTPYLEVDKSGDLLFSVTLFWMGSPGSRCCTNTYAMPVSAGRRARRSENDSSPPAEAPIPTIERDIACLLQFVALGTY